MVETPVHVACLCAAWCRLCDDYRPTLDKVIDELIAQGRPVVAHWIDIEDDAELLGDVDVENFPTLVVIDERQVRFAGTITPQPDTLRRLLRATVVDAAAGAAFAAVDPEVEAFAARLRQQPAAGRS